MANSRSELERWLRPDLILIDDDGDGALLLDVFADVVSRMALDPVEPTAVELLMCRNIAASLWRFDRQNSNAEAMVEEILNTESYAEARRNAYAEEDDRMRLRGICMASCMQGVDLLRQLRRGADFNESVVQPDNLYRLDHARKG